MTATTTFTLKRQKEDGRPYLTITGSITDETDLDRLFGEHHGVVHVDLFGIERVTSRGVRNWVRYLRARKDDLTVVLHYCSIPVVEQAAIIEDFLALGRVVSFYAPYTCVATGKDYEMLLTLAEHFPDSERLEAPTLPCPDNPRLMLDFDEDDHEYLVFLDTYFKRQRGLLADAAARKEEDGEDDADDEGGGDDHLGAFFDDEEE